MQELLQINPFNNTGIQELKDKLAQGYTVIHIFNASFTAFQTSTSSIHYILQKPDENKTDQTNN
jgi:hypothetical protein